MRASISILCIILVIFTNPVELIWRFRKKASIHPSPIQLNVRHYESFAYPGHTFGLRAGSFYVGTDKGHEYVIGIMILRHLFPLTSPSPDLHNTYERVKIRIQNNIATEIVPILSNDPLNDLFFKKFGPDNVRSAEIPEYE